MVSIDAIESDGLTPLHRAAEHSKIRKAIEFRLAIGAKPGLRIRAGQTTLSSAARSNNRNIFDALSAHKVDQNLRDYDSDNALHVAGHYR